VTTNEVASAVLSTLTADERRTSAVYLDLEPLPPGAAHLGTHTVVLSGPAWLAFIDLEPQINWAHRCRYYLVDFQTGEVTIEDAEFPPFMKGASPTLRLIWKGEEVPEWTLATTEKEG
jgi:hypothetical protein